MSTSIKSVSAIQIQNVISKVFSELTGDECMVVICEMRFEASAMQDFAGGETFSFSAQASFKPKKLNESNVRSADRASQMPPNHLAGNDHPASRTEIQAARPSLSNRTVDPSSGAPSLPLPAVESLRILVCENNHRKVCAFCKDRIPRNHLTLTGSEEMFVFCDKQCFDDALRAVAYYCGWIRLFESSVHDEHSDCSVCNAEIHRGESPHLNFVVHDRSHTEAIEVAVLCDKCASEFQGRWERRALSCPER